ncbi:MAG: hypothetical protein ABI778_08790, partial [Ignavibacteriota bacterium]
MRTTPLYIVMIVITAFLAPRVHGQSLRAELNISPRPSMRLSDWESQRETATLLIYSTDSKPNDIRIDAKLSLNGSLIASTKLGSMPVISIPPGGPIILFAADLFPESAVSFSGDLKTSTMRTGLLPE